MNPTKIISTEEFSDYTRVKPLYNSATDAHQIDGFQVQFELEVDGIAFLAVFQSENRINGMMAYNGYEMAPGYCDACQYHEIEEYLGEDTDECKSFLAELKAIATDLAKDELELWVEEIKEQGLSLDALYKKNNHGDLVIVNE